MPHFSIEYSTNRDTRVDIDGWCGLMLDTGISEVMSWVVIQDEAPSRGPGDDEVTGIVANRPGRPPVNENG